MTEPLPPGLRVDQVARAIMRRTGQSMTTLRATMKPVPGTHKWWTNSGNAHETDAAVFVATIVGRDPTLMQGRWDAEGDKLRLLGARIQDGSYGGPSIAVPGHRVTETMAAAAAGRRLGDVMGRDAPEDLADVRIVYMRTITSSMPGGEPLLLIDLPPAWRWIGRR